MECLQREKQRTFCLGMNCDGRGVAANIVGLFDLYFDDNDVGIDDGTLTVAELVLLVDSVLFPVAIAAGGGTAISSD